jgi:hypothetical protein
MAADAAVGDDGVAAIAVGHHSLLRHRPTPPSVVAGPNVATTDGTDGVTSRPQSPLSRCCIDQHRRLSSSLAAIARSAWQNNSERGRHGDNHRGFTILCRHHAIAYPNCETAMVVTVSTPLSCRSPVAVYGVIDSPSSLECLRLERHGIASP